MQITEVEIKQVDSQDRLRAFVQFVIDGEFIVRDAKLLDGPQGLFVAMPSRKITAYCPSCNHKNVVMANYCNQCGAKLPPYDPIPGDRVNVDVAHPINKEARRIINDAVVKAYEEQVGKVAA